MPDSSYKTFSYRFANRGLTARYVYDKLPPGTYRNLANLEAREENSLSSRYGWQGLSINAITQVNAPLGAAVHTLGRMQGLTQAYRYAGAGGSLFRLAGNGPGIYSSIASGLSGSRMSMFPYRPQGNSTSYLFIADKTKMLKDNGSFVASQNWGVAPPNQPATIKIGDPQKIIIDYFGPGFGLSTLTFANVSGQANVTRVAGTFNGPIPIGLQTVLPTVFQ